MSTVLNLLATAGTLIEFLLFLIVFGLLALVGGILTGVVAHMICGEWETNVTLMIIGAVLCTVPASGIYWMSSLNCIAAGTRTTISLLATIAWAAPVVIFTVLGIADRQSADRTNQPAR